jgi:phosphopentomutase
MLSFIELGLNGQHKYVSRTDAAIAHVFQQFFRWNWSDASLIFTAFDECDTVGHKNGYFSPEQMQCLVRTDGWIGEMLKEIRGLPGENYVIVTTDHGGGGDVARDHGSDSPEDMTIFWACSGPGIPQGVELVEPLSIFDTPVVVAAILGLPAPSVWEGKLPTRIAAALKRRQTSVVTHR